MYNRYIPQPDGSYRRSRVPDPHFSPRPPAMDRKCEEPEEPPCQPAPDPCPHEKPQPRTMPRSRPQRNPPCFCPPSHQSPKQEPKPDNSSGQISSFLRNLLPRDFDTGDLLIVLLLLLMAGDCPEDQNSALLTLALYFIM